MDSQCIDTGDPAGDTDPDGSRRDMGALPTYKTSPQVILTRPLPSEEDVPRETTILATFDMPMNPITINTDHFLVSGEGGDRGGNIVYDALTKTVTFTSDEPFQSGEMVFVQLTGEISSLWGLTLEANYSWSFQITTDTEVVSPDPRVIPKDFDLQQNYPNPFNAETTIRFGIGRPAHVTLSVYNLLGQLVKMLYEGDLDGGGHQISWNGTDQFDRPLASGVYFYRLEAGSHSDLRRMVLLR